MKAEAIDTIRYWMDNHPFTVGRVIVQETPDPVWDFEVYLGGVLYGIGVVFVSNDHIVPRDALRAMWKAQKLLGVAASVWFCDAALGDVFYVPMHVLEKHRSDLKPAEDGYDVPVSFLQGIGRCGM